MAATIVHALAFYMFAFVAVAAGSMVIFSRNPVHSVLFLILTFFNAAGLFVLMGSEFLAMILVVVYVGAVAVLFLFVVMMLDINFAELRRGVMRYLPVGAAIGVVLLAELLVTFGGWAGLQETAPPATSEISNTHALGRLIYTRHVYLFQAAGLILLVAMLGAIVLTLRHRPDVKRQRISTQLRRRREETVTTVSVETGSGIP